MSAFFLKHHMHIFIGILATCWLLYCIFRISNKKNNQFCCHAVWTVSLTSASSGFPQAKPSWVKAAVLELHVQQGLSHRKLADLFNRLYFARTGISVGRTWVRTVLMKHACEALHLQKSLKHRVPLPLSPNAIWGIDTTCIADGSKQQHIVLGVIDHGSRKNIMLQHLQRFNTWTFLGYLFLAIGRFGKPHSIKTDNHPVFHARWVKRVLRWCGVKMRFAEPGKPWQNGRIERFFGTLKTAMAGFVARDKKHLIQALAQFRFWYNVTRPHQHLGGCTPEEAWTGVDPFSRGPEKVQIFSAWNGRLRGLVLRR